MRVFVNATPIEVEPGTDVRGALAVHDPDLAGKVAAGAAYVTDARGIELAGGSALEAGSILRVVVSARRAAGDPDADA
jgi:hypothetical protein